MDVNTIAAGATALLAAQAAGSFASEAGKSAWSVTTRIAGLVQRKSERDIGLQAALEGLHAQPSDERTAAEVTHNLERLAAIDDAFLSSLEALIVEANRNPALSSIFVAGSARVGKIATFRDVQGDVNF
jgi:hypothetical protein